MPKYILMNANIPVGDLNYNVNTQRFSFEKYDSIVENYPPEYVISSDGKVRRNIV